MVKYSELRQHLHRNPEMSGQEMRTAETVQHFLQETKPQQVITDVGGYGIAAVYAGSGDGPRVLVRCELDALPIDEAIDLPYGSRIAGVSHKCGHDGHIAILAGLADRLHTEPLTAGSVVLLFQPAEESGEGAARVLADSKFELLQPDLVLALHNLPGFPRGQIILREDVFASASCGIRIDLVGRTSHAAEPESGNSPALAVAQLIQSLSAVPQFHTALYEAAKVTVIHARVGEVAFGTSPGEGRVMATLRAYSQDVLDRLTRRVEELAERTAAAFGLKVSMEAVEPFPATVNDARVTGVIEAGARDLGMDIHRPEQPFAWSEDFGHFTAAYRGALFGLGAGESHPALHNPEYDFPDALIDPGIELLNHIVRKLTESEDV